MWINMCKLSPFRFFKEAEESDILSLFTKYGTLMGHDDNVDVNFARSWSAFAGMTWRLHESKLRITGQTDLDVCLKPMKTLSYATTPDASELASIVVEYRGIVSAVFQVKNNLLLATQMETDKFKGEIDEIATRIAGLSGAFESENAVVETNTTSSSSEDAAKSVSSNATNSPKPGKLSILDLKAEGMAEYIRKQYPNSMPPDFD